MCICSNYHSGGSVHFAVHHSWTVLIVFGLKFSFCWYMTIPTWIHLWVNNGFAYFNVRQHRLHRMLPGMQPDETAFSRDLKRGNRAFVFVYSVLLTRSQCILTVELSESADNAHYSRISWSPWSDHFYRRRTVFTGNFGPPDQNFRGKNGPPGPISPGPNFQWQYTVLCSLKRKNMYHVICGKSTIKNTL